MPLGAAARLALEKPRAGRKMKKIVVTAAPDLPVELVAPALPTARPSLMRRSVNSLMSLLRS